MPFGDRTGPQGLGPMTGRGAGFCAGFGVPGSMNPGFGRGFVGRGRGGGRGWRNWFYATGLTGRQRTFGWPFSGGPQAFAPTRDQKIGALKAQTQHFESALADIRKRIEELEAKPKDE
ncbi:MAG TPA: DUF5320 domain-containing protein [Bryobacteraceae bacterium]|nr:DUF5320 domain-containing protein [Bryobacteraceae bacterium]HOL70506.1 DUF5320 domain-containing protein [Bryobacteraceae bacterium]